MVICSNPDPTIANVCYLRATAPVAPYTLTFGGECMMAKHSGIQLGTSTVPLTYANQITFNFSTLSTGTTRYGFDNLVGGASTITYYPGSSTFLFYGTPRTTTLRATLAADAATGQNTIIVNEDVSSKWIAGDTVVVGKSDIQSVGITTSHTITGTPTYTPGVGTTITLSTNLATRIRKAGGSVILNSPTGLYAWRVQMATASYHRAMTKPSNMILKGGHFTGSNYIASSYYYTSDETNETRCYIENCYLVGATTSYTYFFSGPIPQKGIEFNNVVANASVPLNGASVYYKSNVYKSGDIKINGMYVLNPYQYTGGITKAVCDFRNMSIENPDSALTYIFSGNCGGGSHFENIYLYGVYCNNTPQTTGALYVSVQSIKSLFKDIYIDRCNAGYTIAGTGVVIDCEFDNFNLGTLVANNYNYSWLQGAYFNSVIKNSPQLSGGYYLTEDLADGTEVKYVNVDDVSTKDLVIELSGKRTRCGIGLTDTTVYGTDSYSLRFESDTSDIVEFCYDNAIGNQINKELFIAVYCKISSANYWSGSSYTMPRLIVNYDDGVSTVYAEAAKITDWQLLVVSFTPLTSTGVVEICLETQTDVTGADSYVYFGHFSGTIPTPVNLDIWFEASPQLDSAILQTNADFVAGKVWGTNKSLMTTTDTAGQIVSKKLLKTSSFLALK
jgi:hypothetical protein